MNDARKIGLTTAGAFFALALPVAVYRSGIPGALVAAFLSGCLYALAPPRGDLDDE